MGSEQLKRGVFSVGGPGTTLGQGCALFDRMPPPDKSGSNANFNCFSRRLNRRSLIGWTRLLKQLLELDTAPKVVDLVGKIHAV